MTKPVREMMPNDFKEVAYIQAMQMLQPGYAPEAKIAAAILLAAILIFEKPIPNAL